MYFLYFSTSTCKEGKLSCIGEFIIQPCKLHNTASPDKWQHNSDYFLTVPFIRQKMFLWYSLAVHIHGITVSMNAVN